MQAARRRALRLALAAGEARTEHEPVQAFAGMTRRCEKDVVEYRDASECARHLERAHEAAAGDPVRWCPVDPVALEFNRSALCGQEAGDTLNSVDLPAPLGPIRAVIEPARRRTTPRRRLGHRRSGARRPRTSRIAALIPAPSPCGCRRSLAAGKASGRSGRARSR